MAFDARSRVALGSSAFGSWLMVPACGVRTWEYLGDSSVDVTDTMSLLLLQHGCNKAMYMSS